jgi:putative ABC transport system permease protein
MWPREDPIGKRLAWPPWDGTRRPPLEVVGLAADTRSRALNAAPVPLLYVPLLQNYDGRARLLVRTRASSTAALGRITRAVADVNPDLPVFGADTMENHVAVSLWQQRMALGAIGAFSLLALALTAIGLYGVIAQSVAQRAREVGIRMALGAAPSVVSRMMLTEGMLLAAVGIAAGLPIVPAAARLLGFGVDPAACLAGALLLAGVLLAACWLPARGAARVDPVVALRD